VTQDQAALEWYRVADLDDLPEGRVRTVTARDQAFALTHFNGSYAAFDNRCPHQGGPLGEGSIEKGWLRCPWHGYDYDPISGEPPGGFSDCPIKVEAEVRDDGVYIGLEPAPAHIATTSDLMVETMVNWGVKHVFGMVGHSNLGFAEAMRRAEADGKLSYIGIRHEGAAAFAASAYAKLTGEPAAVFTIAGPGATNLMTGLWDAQMDRAPVLALTGQVASQVMGPGDFQEIDIASAFEAVTAWSATVMHDSRHAELMNLALKHAHLDRGVGHLILPNEVQTIPAPEGAEPGTPEGRLPDFNIAPAPDSVARACQMIDEAQRPAIVVGHGARFRMAEVLELAERLSAPVLTTFKGKGQINDDHPLAAGVLGRSGTPIASWMQNEADLLIVFGASFSTHTGIAEYQPTIQVDYDPMTLGKFHSVTEPVLGEIGVTARLLIDGLAEDGEWDDQRETVAERWALWRNEKARREEDDRGEGISGASLFAALTRQAPNDAVIAVDVGNNTYSFGRYFECSGQSVLMSGYLGSIGFGLPAAMGAWAASPERKTIAVCGDGGLGQYLAEVTTAVKYDMNITIVVLNNRQLGKISKEQQAEQFAIWQTSLHNPNFAEYAELCGALGIRVDDAAELDAALERAIAHRGPSLVEVMSDPQLI
jgi:thiamine pyrophosphate-dependent acetolactate synthase large subunit-like protein/nitrite reductase/ring-hydroxylating ferredoxin subunit